MKTYLKISLIYLILGCLWIPVTDWAVRQIAAGNVQQLTDLQTAKGWFFVVISTVVIGLLTRSAWLKQENDALEKKEVFKKTIGGSCHILLNYLNQMQLVTLEAERSADFDRRLLSTARRISREASEELQTLQKMDIKDPTEIEDFVFRNINQPPEPEQTQLK